MSCRARRCDSRTFSGQPASGVAGACYMVSGLLLCKSLLPAELIESCRAQADAAYQKLRGGQGEAAWAPATPALPANERFVPTASSFTIGAVLSEADIQAVSGSVMDGESGAWLEVELDGEIIFHPKQSWVRRQYAPCNYPPMHAPHGWHQDGALGFDFTSYPNGDYPPEALLEMGTCWIALDACGKDAPGLEVVMERFSQVLPPSDLAEAA